MFDDLPTKPQDLLAKLTSLGIKTTTHEHPPVYTVEEAQAHTNHLPGGHCKNLFLRDKKKNTFLIVTLDERQVDLKAITSKIGAQGNVSFGKPERLFDMLGVRPGSVTPFSIINDTDHQVQVILDKHMMENYDILNYHPLHNTMTTAISPNGLLKFIEHFGHTPKIVDLTDDAS